MNYVLPNSKRVRRPCSNQKKDAMRSARFKQEQLANGKFDEYDRKKLGEYLKTKKKLTLEEAKSLYFEITSDAKSKRAMQNDTYLLKSAFGFFEDKGLVYLEDVSPIDCVRFIAHLRERKLKAGSIKSYWMAVSKVYNRLNKMKLISIDNPMIDVGQPKGSDLIRNRIPTIEEIDKILVALSSLSGSSSHSSPIESIVRFALYTGARIGEVLHAEWTDFDLEKGYWILREKPDCPAFDGIGWSPKWGKERVVKLFPEACSILKNLPILETIGVVDGENGEKTAVSANFVFPKKQIKILDNCPMQIKKGYYKCTTCKDFPDRTLCDYRIVIYSRCDSIRTAWATVKKRAGVSDLRMHDLRRFFNRVILQERLGFTPEEAGKYIGNSKEVNMTHYSPISVELLSRKLGSKSFSEVLVEADQLPN